VLDSLGARLETLGFKHAGEAVLAGQACPVYRKSEFRWSWFATRLHTFVFVLELPQAITDDQAKAIAEAGRDYAVRNKGGLIRGLQTGSTAVPVLLMDGVHEQVAQWAAAPQRLRFAVGLFPIVADYDRSRVAYRVKPQKWGRVYEAFLRQLAAQLVGEATVP
jgi:hypothetical protein